MAPERTRVLAVAGGRPGLGASVASALVAMAAMAAGARVHWLEAHAAEGGPDTLARRLHDAPPHDLAVVDAGARLDGVTAACALGDCTLLLVTGDDPADIAAGYAVAKAAHASATPPSLAAASSRVDATQGRWAADALAEACLHFLGARVQVAGHLPDDPTLAAALAAGMSIGDAAVGSPALDSAADILDQLRPRGTPSPAARSLPSLLPAGR